MKLIDKQKALDALMAEREYLLARGQESAEHVLTHHAYNIIDEQPIVESRPKGKWVPCSERLPDKQGLYLVTNSKVGANIIDTDIWFDSPNTWLYDDDVIAWMPLPEPYKAD